MWVADWMWIMLICPLWCGLNESFSHLHVLPSPPMSIRNCVFVYTDLCIIFRMRIIIYSCMYHISSRIHGGVILCPSRPRACLRCIGIHALTIMDECLLPCSARYCTRDCPMPAGSCITSEKPAVNMSSHWCLLQRPLSQSLCS